MDLTGIKYYDDIDLQKYQWMGISREGWMDIADGPEYNPVEEIEKAAMIRPMTLIEHYQYRIKDIEKELTRLRELVELLQRNPETKRILELMGRKGI